MTTCEIDYYPPWSSRGMRSVRCTHKAKWTIVTDSGATNVCGIHRRSEEGFLREIGKDVVVLTIAP